MKSKIVNLFGVSKFKFVFLLSGYLLITEIIKNSAEVYVLERSFELKLFLLAVTIIAIYNVSYYTVTFGILALILLSVFSIPTGNMVYILLITVFFKLIKHINNKLE